MIWLGRLPIRRLAVIFVAITATAASAQGQVQTHSGWLASFNTIALNEEFSLHAEFQLRTTDEWEQIQTLLPRAGLNYHLASNQVITGGYAYIPNRVPFNGESDFLAEHRVWQQYLVSHKAGPVAISHRFRLEQRFVPSAVAGDEGLEVDEYNYSTRFRYFVRGIIPLSNRQSFTRGGFVALQNEFFMNISNQDNVNGQFFDQNRAYGAVGYRFGKQLDVEAGYMNQYLRRRPLAGRSNDLSNHIVQLAFYTRL